MKIGKKGSRVKVYSTMPQILARARHLADAPAAKAAAGARQMKKRLARLRVRELGGFRDSGET